MTAGTRTDVHVEMARTVADAVLWEGYVLYPYRRSDGKNRVRWQFGVVMPQVLAPRTSEPWMQQTEVLVEAAPGGVPTADATVDVTLRFLQVQARVVEAVAGGGFTPVDRLDVDGDEHLTFDEAVEREVTYPGIPLGALLDGERELPIGVPSGRDVEPIREAAGTVAGRFVRLRWNLFGLVRLSAERVGERIRVRVVTENRTDWTEPGEPDRTAALRRSFVGTHTMLSVRDGAFVSVLDPPADAEEAARACANVNTWPVLVGEAGQRDVVLSSPIILYDYPQVAPESAGDLFDATEIDEILLLRVLTLTDAEKAEARATDARARDIIDRADTMPPEVFEKLHGAIRYLRRAGADAGEQPPEAASGKPGPQAGAAVDSTHVASGAAGLRMGWGEAPPVRGVGRTEGSFPGPDLTAAADRFGELFGEASQGPPDIGTIRIGEAEVGKGTRVRINPRRRADAHDIFLRGLAGKVAGVFEDVDGGVHVAVTIDDDPSGELDDWYGRHYYFDASEVEPIP